MKVCLLFFISFSLFASEPASSKKVPKKDNKEAIQPLITNKQQLLLIKKQIQAIREREENHTRKL